MVLLVFGRSLCSWVIDYFWWGEMGQVPTWVRMTAYRYLPGLAAWVIVFAVLWVAHARGMKHARESLRDHPAYARISTLVLAFVALMVTLSTVDGWTVARFVGGQAAQAASTSWSDPVFGRPLEFYFFALPFYDMLLTWVAAAAFCGALAYYLAARGWQLRRDMPGFTLGQDIDLRDLRTLGRLETGLLKALVALFLVALAAEFWLGRYQLLFTDHGNLMVGIDYVQQSIGLPLQTLKAGAALLAALLVLAGRRKIAIACAVVLVFDWLLPPLVGGLYVRPNELTLEKPYLVRHIEATRAAYGLDHRAKITEFAAQKDGPINFAANQRPARERAPVGLARLSRHAQPEPAAAPLYLRRYRCRPLSDRRPSAPDAARAARTGSQSVGRRAQSLDQSRPDVHAWLRLRHGGGQPHQRNRPARIVSPRCAR